VQRVIIDSNRLQHDDLRDFLTRSVQNLAVLTDYAWMEAYKGNSIKSIQRSMSVLKDFPSQVVILKGTKAVCTLDPSAPGIAKRMQWPSKNGDFTQTVSGLQRAAAGHHGALSAIVEHGQAADRQMQTLLEDMAGLPKAFGDMVDTLLTKDDVVAIRARRPHSVDLVQKMLDIAEQIAIRFYAAHPLKPRRPTLRARFDAFIYRFALGAVLYLVEWIAEGSQVKKAAEKFRNDTIDINFAVYGTYFNGVMSGDRRVQSLYYGLSIILTKLEARVPTAWDIKSLSPQ
jgi:hypothetical protein